MSTVTRVAASTSVMTLLAADTDNYRRASLYFDGATIMYVLVGGNGTPSATNFSFKMGDGLLTYWEHPATNSPDAVKAICAAAVGAVQVTEYV